MMSWAAFSFLISAVCGVSVTRIEPGWCPGESECRPVLPMGRPFEVVADVDDVVPGTEFTLLLEPVVSGPPFEPLTIGTPYVVGPVFRFSMSALGMVPGDYRFVFKFGGQQTFAGGVFTLVYHACTTVTTLPVRRTRRSAPSDALEKRQPGAVGCLLAGGIVSGTCRTQQACVNATGIPSGQFSTGCMNAGGGNNLCCPNNPSASWGTCTLPNSGGRTGRCIDDAACWTTPAAQANGACGEFPSPIRCCPAEPEPSVEAPLRGVCVASVDWCVNRLRGSVVDDSGRINSTVILRTLSVTAPCVAQLLCCVDALVAKPTPTPAPTAPLLFEQPKAPVRMPQLIGSLMYVSWSGGGGPGVSFDTVELLPALDLTRGINLTRVDVRTGSARVLLEHPVANSSIAPSMYRLRLRGVLSDPFVIGAAVCDSDTVGICVESVHCETLGANWTVVAGVCPKKTVCCANRLMTGVVARNANRTLRQPTATAAPLPPVPSLSVVFVAGAMNGSNVTALPFLETPNGHAAIAGGVIGGLVLFCLIGLCVVCLLRGRRGSGNDDHVIAGNTLYHKNTVPMDAIFAGSSMKTETFPSLHPILPPSSTDAGTLRPAYGEQQAYSTTTTVLPGAYLTAQQMSNRNLAVPVSDRSNRGYPLQPSYSVQMTDQGATAGGSIKTGGSIKGATHTVPTGLRPVYAQPEDDTPTTLVPKYPSAAFPGNHSAADVSLGSYTNKSNASMDVQPGGYSALPSDAIRK